MIEEDINRVNIADQIAQLENGGSLGNKVNQIIWGKLNKTPQPEMLLQMKIFTNLKEAKTVILKLSQKM